jgi:hypothetical protein
MFTIAYFKNTKKIAWSRFDSSTLNDLLTPQQLLERYCDDNDLDVNDYIALELPWDKKLRIVIGNHVYNESAQKIEADPNYVPPPAPEPIAPPAPAQ